MKIKDFKRQTKSFFHKGCENCYLRNLCISATSLASNKRKYFFKIKNIREPVNQAMLEGKQRHIDYCKGIPTVEEIGLKKFKYLFQKKDVQPESITVKEVKICNTYYGIRGYIDLLEINRDGNNLTLNITELKSGFIRQYIFQLLSYALVLSNKNSYVILANKKRDNAYKIYHRNTNLNVNINASLYIFKAKKPYIIPFMKDNLMTNNARGICFGILRKANDYRLLHDRQLIYLSEIPKCSNCKERECYYYDKYCSKVSEDMKTKTKQLYWGRKQLLIKTKPIILLDKLC